MNRISKFRMSTLACLFAAFGSAGVALAQQPPGGAQGHGRHGQSPLPFEQIDSNDDGLISQAEADAFFAERRAGLDANGDGVVTFEEAQAHEQAQREQRARDRFAQLDANGDGQVTLDELPDPEACLFDLLDANDDGVIDQAEARARQGWRCAPADEG